MNYANGTNRTINTGNQSSSLSKKDFAYSVSIGAIRVIRSQNFIKGTQWKI
jgi:hypothetical protein